LTAKARAVFPRRGHGYFRLVESLEVVGIKRHEMGYRMGLHCGHDSRIVRADPGNRIGVNQSKPFAINSGGIREQLEK